MGKRIPTLGIAICMMYFIAVSIFLITKTEIALTIWEVLTIIGAPVILFVLLELSNQMNIASFYRNVMLVFLSCTCSLTGVAHVVNITVTRRLISEGIKVPDYFKIGYWPSVEMAVDYLAWGFFVGLAFLSIGIAINASNKLNLAMKKIVLLCGILCLAGFVGTVFINENLWYLAPLGYGFGTIVICIKMLKMNLEKNKL